MPSTRKHQPRELRSLQADLTSHFDKNVKIGIFSVDECDNNSVSGQIEIHRRLNGYMKTQTLLENCLDRF